jgi:hypothetical protein
VRRVSTGCTSRGERVPGEVQRRGERGARILAQRDCAGSPNMDASSVRTVGHARDQVGAGRDRRAVGEGPHQQPCLEHPTSMTPHASRAGGDGAWSATGATASARKLILFDRHVAARGARSTRVGSGMRRDARWCTTGSPRCSRRSTRWCSTRCATPTRWRACSCARGGATG